MQPCIARISCTSSPFLRLHACGAEHRFGFMHRTASDRRLQRFSSTAWALENRGGQRGKAVQGTKAPILGAPWLAVASELLTPCGDFVSTRNLGELLAQLEMDNWQWEIQKNFPFPISDFQLRVHHNSTESGSLRLWRAGRTAERRQVGIPASHAERSGMVNGSR